MKICVRCVALIAGMTFVSIAGYAQAPGKADPAAPVPEEVIRKFAEKETEFFEAWKQYAYRQVADIRVLSVDGRPSNERMQIESEVIFDDSGRRDIQILRRSGGLRSVVWTPDDEKVIHDIQPFALTSAELPLYNVNFVGREKVDELDCFAFSVKPKSMKKGRLYFEGKIWVDDRDYQIVRTLGKAVPQTADSQFPEFETIRQIVDKQYWFPAWTHADSVLRFRAGRIRIEETITYEDYKRFGSKATIDFGPTKPPE